MAAYPNWLKSAVFYEIYPQSFYDTNGDGIGDLRGIIAKLDYIESLGCDAIWVHPCFVSPFHDAGYDVSDFCKVAPRYGTNADMKRLVREARKKGIRICLDLVPGHTSVEHPWFRASCESKKNKYSNRYIWTDGWVRDSAGMGCMRGYGERDGAFVTNFFWCQPALNYGFAKPDPKYSWQLPVDHPDVKATREELKNIIRFWLDMGVAGFRVDMAASLVKNDPGYVETIRLWQGVRQMLDKDYPEAVLISEWLDPPVAIEAGFHVDFASIFSDSPYQGLFRRENNANVHYDVEGKSFFDRDGQGDALPFFSEYLSMLPKLGQKGLVGLYSSNHDISRISVNRSQKEIELVFAFLMTMPGVPFIYYGDEIGMKYFPDLKSKEGGYTRTGSRTPMQWTAGRNAGFSTASKDKLYLPVDPAKRPTNVESQDCNPRSLLNAVRRLSKLRNATPALQADGEFISLFVKKNTYPIAYLRRSAEQAILVIINPSGQEVAAKFKIPQLDSVGKQIAGRGARISKSGKSFIATMPKCSYGVFEL